MTSTSRLDKVRLTARKLELTVGKVDMTVGNVDVTVVMLDLTTGKAALNRANPNHFQA